MITPCLKEPVMNCLNFSPCVSPLQESVLLYVVSGAELSALMRQALASATQKGLTIQPCHSLWDMFCHLPGKGWTEGKDQHGARGRPEEPRWLCLHLEKGVYLIPRAAKRAHITHGTHAPAG